MASGETSPLLSTATAAKGKSLDNNSGETTPLLSSTTDTPRYDGDNDEPGHEVASVRSHLSDGSSIHSHKTKSTRRWPSFIAMGVLGLMVIAIIALAYIVPDAVQEYAKQAAVVEPTSLSLESITADGLRARIQATFRLDGARVANGHVRRVGKAATWIANQLGTEETTIVVTLPDYENLLLGTATIPPLVIYLKDGEVTDFDFVTDIVPGNMEGIRSIANEWLEGRLDKVRLRGKADLALKSGLLPLGTHSVAESLVFEAKKIPAMPQYNITRLNVKDVPGPGDKQSMLAEVTIVARNEYPVKLDVPELAFEILVPGCHMDDLIVVADAVTSEMVVKPRSDVQADVHGIIRELPESLTRDCPDSKSSPLDILLRQYMQGEAATFYVRGSSRPDGSTPRWLAEILSSVTLPVAFPGSSLDGLIRNFSMSDVHFTMPDPFADPDDPASDPTVSGNILVTAGLPSEMNFGINVTKVRALADVYYKKDKLGVLDLKKWQDANSTRVEEDKKHEASLKIASWINEAPLHVTNGTVFGDVVQQLLFGTKAIQLTVKAAVDVKVETSLGRLVLKEVPAEGMIPVKPLSNGKDWTGNLAPKIRSLRILDTTSTSITLQALVNVTNPTPYTASVPYINIHVLHNDTVLADSTVENLEIVKGDNTNILVTATWNPSRSGKSGHQIGRDLISQYLSGFNTSIAVKAHSKSIPGQPILCEGLSQLNLTLAAPKLELPGRNAEERSHFIRDATFHFFSSTATFTLASPLKFNTMYIDYVNATAFFNHTEEIGRIVRDLPFEAPPGQSTTPRLPVQWSVGSVGYDAVRKALGGNLKLDARANVDVRLGNWKESLWYIGRGIGARVQF
ncbi:hypothetical protein PG996_003705 [Apiospora saccharicola]|uniref:Pre-rRNA processing protein n=1 Tax=Apiospora saccharicola TaxID=335842 RepID=A0ABR1W210_9PEZI